MRLQCGRPGFDPWVGKFPWRRERLPTSVFWSREFHGQYTLWGRKESPLSNFHFHTRTAGIIIRNYAIKLHHHFCFPVNISSVREIMVSYPLCMFMLKLHILARLVVRFTAGTSESDSLGSNSTSISF